MDYSPYNPYSLLFLIGSLVCAKSLQFCPTLLNPMDCRLPGSSIHGTIQARILEWVAISFSRRSFPPRDQTCVSCITCIGRLILYHYSTREVLLYQGIHTAEKHKQTNKQNPHIVLEKKNSSLARIKKNLPTGLRYWHTFFWIFFKIIGNLYLFCKSSIQIFKKRH